MKKRFGFISNSSSSSFVVFGASQAYEVPQILKTQKDKKTIKIPQTFGGETEFGRQRQNYTDFGSRLNWAILQVLYVKEAWDEKDSKKRKYINSVYEGKNLEFLTIHHNDLDLLYKVLKENLKIDNIINNLDLDSFENKCFDDPKINGYIDHESNWHGNKNNVIHLFGEIPNEDHIFEWLFNSEGFIANRSDEYEDSTSLEVDHRLDYKNYDDFYNSYQNPELFDKKGNFK
jgi:hypothetical protein